MATLHLVNKPAALRPCLECLAPEDIVLLLEDGVYAAAGQDPAVSVLVLRYDAKARAVEDRISGRCRLISDAEFVELVVEHQPIVTWR